jgi:PAS domain S-box-containing protein
MPKPAESNASAELRLASARRPSPSAYAPNGTLPRQFALQAGFWTAFMLLHSASAAFRTWAGTPAWYLPAGLSLAILVWGGMRYVPIVIAAGVTAGAFNYHRGLFSWVELPGTIAMTLAYVAGAAWLRNVWRVDTRLRRLRDVGGLALFLLLGVLPAALIGVLALLGDGFIARPDFLKAVFNWWVGDSISVASFAPFLLLHVAPGMDAFLGASDAPSPSLFPSIPWRKRLPAAFELSAELASIFLAIWLVFGFRPAVPYQPLYALFFPVIWMAVRHGLSGAATGVLLVNVGVMLAANLTRPDVTGLPRLQLVMLALAVTGLCLGAVVSERSQAEAALSDSERRYRVLFESAGDAIFLMRDDRFTDCNQKALDMFGCARHQLVGQTPYAFSPPKQGDGADSREAALARIGGALEGEILQYEWRHQRADGTPFETEVTLSRLEIAREPHLLAMVRDITDRKRAQDEARLAFEQLRALAAHLESIREEERKRVARDIHDQLGQALTALKIDLTGLLRDLPPDPGCQAKADSILRLSSETIHSVRRIASELRPGVLDDLGLVAAVEWASEEFQSRTGTACSLELPAEDLHADPAHATALFRILQETLTNVARHAGATRVDVSLTRSNADLILEVHDNGVGIPVEKLSQGQSLGILGMRERATLLGGDLFIRGAPGGGTLVRVRIPADRRGEATL